MRKIFISGAYAGSTGKDALCVLKDKIKSLDFELVTLDECLLNSLDIHRSTIELINSCNIFVCIYDGSSPNITFELGYAIGRNKKVVLVAYHEELPFDIKHLCYINRGLPDFEIFQSIISFIEAETVK